MMTFKKIVNKLHLWLGFASGLVVFIVAITGCFIAFEDEIREVTRSYRNIETPENATLLAPSALAEKAAQALGRDEDPKGIVYDEEGKTASVWFWGFAPEYFYTVHTNPYTGEVMAISDEEVDFFHIMTHGHYYLWLPPAIGQPVVSYATLIFAVMLITGLILWWPKNKKARKQRFTIKWNARWRRVNYDLHGVFGFYAMGIGLILAITGMVMGMEWFSNTVYHAAGGEGSSQYLMPASDTTAVREMPAPRSVADGIFHQLLPEKPDQGVMYISFPQEKAGSVYTYINYDPESYHQVDYYHFDQYTLKKIPSTGPYDGAYAEAGFADKLLRMNYDIHRGAILGLTGKIIAFIASLVIATLPVTGITIWWGRRKKKKKKVLKPRSREQVNA